jgi:hypothetical protein
LKVQSILARDIRSRQVMTVRGRFRVTSMMIGSARAGDGEHFPYTTLPGSQGKGGKQANEVNE